MGCGLPFNFGLCLSVIDELMVELWLERYEPVEIEPEILEAIDEEFWDLI